MKKIAFFVSKNLIRFKVFFKFLFRKKRKLNVGAGLIKQEHDWFSSDLLILNILDRWDWIKLLGFLKVDVIFAEHVWEHLDEKHIIVANKNCFDFLKRNGVLRLAVPDGYHPDQNYIDYVRPGGTGPDKDLHKVLFNYKILKESLEKVGFEVTLLEYWDENGQFHFIDWSHEYGLVGRSRRDRRNKDGILKYTSLIIDAVKIDFFSAHHS